MTILLGIEIGMSIVASGMNKNKHFWGFVMFVLLSIVYFNVDVGLSGDLYEYERIYFAVRSSMPELLYHGNEPLFVLLMTGFSKLGATFLQFRNAIFVGSLALIIYNALSFTDNIPLFLGAYCSYFFFLDGYQLRSMVAFAVLSFGLRELLKESRMSVAYFIIAVILSAMVQRTFLLFIILILIRFKEEFNKQEVILAIVATGFVFVVESRLGVLSSLFMGDSYGQIYLGVDIHYGWLVPTFMYFANIAWFLLSDRFFFAQGDVYYESLYKTMCKLNIVCMFYIPFFTMNLSFYRFLRYVMLTDLIYYAMCCERLETGSKRVLYTFATIVFEMLMFFCDCIIHGGFWEIVCNQFLHI